MTVVWGTHFASPERVERDECIAEGQILQSTPLIRQLLDSFPEPVVILNSHRQIVMANDKLQALVGATEESILGKRPGEAVNCTNWAKEPGGCGTTKFCRYCGAVGAIVASQNSGIPASSECRITSGTRDGDVALDLRVWATPLTLHQKFTVFAIRDISDEKRRNVLERMFFHDVLNVAGALRGLMEQWPELTSDEARELSPVARDMAYDLVDQIQAGQDLAAAERNELDARFEDMRADELLLGIVNSLQYHPLAKGKQIVSSLTTDSVAIRSDRVLLRRVLVNLIKNAIEASEQGQAVTVSFSNQSTPTFTVHNETTMHEDVQLQLFQRSFSTKSGTGRGVGSYSVKLLTEKYLRGTVTFSSSEAQGTTFTVRLPAK